MPNTLVTSNKRVPNITHSTFEVNNLTNNKYNFKSSLYFIILKKSNFNFFEKIEINDIDTTSTHHIDLENINDVHYPYKASMKSLEEDWNSPEDDHWDNY